MTRFDTGEMILVPVLNVRASSQRLTYDGSKSLISTPYEFTSLSLDGHGALGVENVERPRGRHKPDFVGRVGHKPRRRMLTWELQTLHFGTAASHPATSPGVQAGTVNMRND